MTPAGFQNFSFVEPLAEAYCTRDLCLQSFDEVTFRLGVRIWSYSECRFRNSKEGGRWNEYTRCRNRHWNLGTYL
jgi:hypothetical protein